MSQPATIDVRVVLARLQSRAEGLAVAGDYESAGIMSLARATIVSLLPDPRKAEPPKDEEMAAGAPMTEEATETH